MVQVCPECVPAVTACITGAAIGATFASEIYEEVYILGVCGAGLGLLSFGFYLNTLPDDNI